MGEPDEEQRRVNRTVTVFGFAPDKVEFAIPLAQTEFDIAL